MAMILAYTNMVGKRFGRLVVIKAEEKKLGKFYWNCLCDCGKSKNVIHGNLIHKKTTSCGCLHREMVSVQFKKHGLTKDPLYSVWAGMRRRCLNKNDSEYKNYGGRGIKICDEWSEFIVFYKWGVDNGYKKGLSLDRIDVDGNYCPQNCQWATNRQQSRNKRNTLLLNNELMIEASYRLGGNSKLVWDRINKLGWDIEKAFNQKKQT